MAPSSREKHANALASAKETRDKAPASDRTGCPADRVKMDLARPTLTR